MGVPFTRLAVVNRGDAALRVIDAVAEYNGEHGTDVRTVVLYGEGDRTARYVREADEAVPLGGDGSGRWGGTIAPTPEALAGVLARAGADAAWIGWDFLPSHAVLAEVCETSGRTFVGPPSSVLRRLAAPGALTDLGSALGLAVAGPGDVAPGTRRVSVPLLADAHGTVWVLGVCDATLRRRGVPVLVESALADLDPGVEQALRNAARELALAVGYRSAGALDALVAPDGSFALCGFDAQLPGDHPVIERATGLDVVKHQLAIAAGAALEGPEPEARGHAVVVRLNAQDPDRGCQPTPGRVLAFRPPGGAGIRVDTSVDAGDLVPAATDPLLARIVAWGVDRREALGRLGRALNQAVVLVEGGSTNASVVLGLLERPEVRDGSADTAWLDRLLDAGDAVPDRDAAFALLAAAVEAYVQDLADAQAYFLATAARGRPEVADDDRRHVELRWRGQTYGFSVQQTGPGRYRVDPGTGPIEITVEQGDPTIRRISVAGQHRRIVPQVEGSTYRILVDGVAFTVVRDEGVPVVSPSPAMVVAVLVSEGQEVAVGDPLVVIESMKMETTLTADVAGRVRRVAVTANAQVAALTPLVLVDPRGSRTAVSDPHAPVRFDALAGETTSPVRNPGERARRAFDTVTNEMLGFDSTPADARSAVAELRTASAALPPGDPRLLRWEDDLLGVFADLCTLTRREPDPDLAEDIGEATRSSQEYLNTFLLDLDAAHESIPATFLLRLQRALRHYGVRGLDHTPELEHALYRLAQARDGLARQVPAVVAVLDRRLAVGDLLAQTVGDNFRVLLDRLVEASQNRLPVVADLARTVRFAYFEEPLLDRARDEVYAEMDEVMALLAANPQATEREQWVQALVECPQPLHGRLLERFRGSSPEAREVELEVLSRRYYRIRRLEDVQVRQVEGQALLSAEYDHEGARVHLVTALGDLESLAGLAHLVDAHLAGVPEDRQPVVDFYLEGPARPESADATQGEVRSVLDSVGFRRWLRRVVVSINSRPSGTSAGVRQQFTFRQPDGAGGPFVEETLYRNLHPMLGKRLDLWRLSNFEVERLPSAEDVYLFRGVARDNPKDERLFAIAEVRDLTGIRDGRGRLVSLPHFERMLYECLSAIRAFQSHRPPGKRVLWNRVILYVRPTWYVTSDEWRDLVPRLSSPTRGLGLEKVVVHTRMIDPSDSTGDVVDMVIHLSNPFGRGVVVRYAPPLPRPIRPLTKYRQKVVLMQRRGFVYPYELIEMLTPPPDAESAFPEGTFTEYDLDEHDELVPVDRPPGENTANLVVGVISNVVPRYPEGMRRVIILGDPSRSLGALAEPECRRINAALDLAERLGVPVEWFALSSGARISMQSGSENMDWISAVLRRIIEFTQAGGELNVVVTGINVGAQPYWNAEATMLMHTKGILVMTPESAMVLTGKAALDFSGGVSAEDNFGIGGFDRVMGPNGQGQYFAPDLESACQVLFRHYDHAYVAPGERFPRRAPTADPFERDVRDEPHQRVPGTTFTRVGDVFSAETNPDRKKPFDIRSVMRAVADTDRAPLERWARMLRADTAVVWDAHVGGIPVCMLGIESRTLPREDVPPADGPQAWTSGTLFPMSSKKIARAINAASNNRPLVVLANLSGFDGSPESMRSIQLEYGAEIGRATVNFKGPIVFCVVSRYHGGAFVVFSKRLNDHMEVVAVEGSFASVIGGAPAAGVVFAREVEARTSADPRVRELRDQVAAAAGGERAMRQAQLDEVTELVRREKIGELAAEYDGIHSIQRALQVGSVDRIIPAATIRPYIISALERGMSEELERLGYGPEAQRALQVDGR